MRLASPLSAGRPPPSPPSSPSSLFSLVNVVIDGGQTLVVTDSLSKFKTDSKPTQNLTLTITLTLSSNPNNRPNTSKLVRYSKLSFPARPKSRVREYRTLSLITYVDIESAFFRLFTFRHRVLLEFRLIWTLYLNLNLDIESTVDLECSTRVRPPDRAQSCATSISRRHPCGQNTYVDIESAFFRLFRHRVLIEFRLIWTLYLNLNLDIESTVDLECSTRVRITPPIWYYRKCKATLRMMSGLLAPLCLSTSVRSGPYVPNCQAYPVGETQHLTLRVRSVWSFQFLFNFTGDTVSVECNPDYDLVGSVVLTCSVDQSAGWQG
eukprot:sb/3479619/